MERNYLVSFLQRKLIKPLLVMVQQGITPAKLALTAGLGVVVGLMPLLGVTTVLGTYLALRLRLNVALMVLINYLMYPLQLLLYIPFIRLGLVVFRIPELRLSVGEIIAMFREDWFLALRKLWFANFLGVLAWGMLAIPLFAVIYLVLLAVFKRLDNRRARRRELVEP